MVVGEVSGKAAQDIDEQPRGSRVGAGVQGQVWMSFPASSLDNLIASGSKDDGLGS